MKLTDEQLDMMCELLSAVPGITAMLDLMKNEDVANILTNPKSVEPENIEEFEVPIRISNPLMLAILKSIDGSVTTAKECFPIPNIADRFKNESALAGVLGHILVLGLKDLFVNNQQYMKEALKTIEDYYKKLGLDCLK